MKKTILLIILCVLATIAHLYFTDNPFISALYFSGENLRRGFFWTPVTSIFIHANLAHLIGNMLFLYVFGGAIEREIGSSKMLAAFFLGGSLSFILSLFFYEPNVIMVGASAAIFTLVAMVMLIKPLKFSWLFLMPLGLVAILYFIYNILAVYTGIGEPEVSYLGHIIGFLVGVPLGISWSRGRWKRNLLVAIALLTLYIIIFGLLL
ncbi:MAG: rhomboid family intramembrane serine protease [Candidatus Bathyarchaeia archaeon]